MRGKPNLNADVTKVSEGESVMGPTSKSQYRNGNVPSSVKSDDKPAMKKQQKSSKRNKPALKDREQKIVTSKRAKLTVRGGKSASPEDSKLVSDGDKKGDKSKEKSGVSKEEKSVERGEDLGSSDEEEKSTKENKERGKPPAQEHALLDVHDEENYSGEEEVRKDSVTDGKIVPQNETSEEDVRKLSPGNDDEVNGWLPGSLLWARISGHPFWPGIVITDPMSDVFLKTKKGRGTTLLKEYHIQFFGDKGSHCWVPAGRILKFEGKEKLKSVAMANKKDKKFVGALPDSKGSSLLKWQCAVREADEAELKSRKDRIEFFEEMYPLQKQKSTLSESREKGKKSDSSIKKRSHAASKERFSEPNDSDEDERPLKRLKKASGKPQNKQEEKKKGKPGVSSSEVKGREEKEGSDSESVSSSESEKKNKRVRRATRKQTRRKKHKKDKLPPGDFEVFFEKSSPHCSEVNARFANDEAALRKYLMKMWSTMTEEEKSKYGEYPVTCS